MSSQGQYRDEKLWKEKRCHIAEQQEISTTWEERTVSQIFNNLKEADCRKGIFRREIRPSLCFLPFQQKQDTSQICVFLCIKVAARFSLSLFEVLIKGSGIAESNLDLKCHRKVDHQMWPNLILYSLHYQAPPDSTI